MRVTIAAACLAAAASLAQAETFSANGTGTATDNSAMFEIAEGHLVMHANSMYTGFEMEDPSNPMQGATGPCFGAAEISAAGVAGNGRCVYTSAEGDTFVVDWVMTGMGETGGTGDWTLKGGTGRFAGGTGGGTFSAANSGDGIETNTITGEITLN